MEKGRLANFSCVFCIAKQLSAFFSPPCNSSLCFNFEQGIPSLLVVVFNIRVVRAISPSPSTPRLSSAAQLGACLSSPF